MEVDMNRYERQRGWMVVLAVVLLSALAGIVAYNIGLSHGFAQSAVEAGEAPHGWHRHGGFGFAFPFFFLLFWFVLLRGFWGWGWGGPWRRHGYYYPGWHDVPPPFDEWRRRAHEAMDDRAKDSRERPRDAGDRDPMKENPSADDPGRRG
jgi:hypothetical protein